MFPEGVRGGALGKRFRERAGEVLGSDWMNCLPDSSRPVVFVMLASLASYRTAGLPLLSLTNRSATESTETK